MAKVTVHIEADSPADFHTALQELIGGAPVLAAEAMPRIETAAPEPAKSTLNKKAADNKQLDTVTERQDIPQSPTADPLPSAKEKAATITHEDLRDAMKSLKASVSRRMVAEFSGKAPEERPRLSDVPAERYADMLAEAKRLSQLPDNIKQEKVDD